MFCRNCGAKIPDDSRFCPQCGEKVVTVSNQSEPKSEYGKNIMILDRFKIHFSEYFDRYNVVRRILEQYASAQQQVAEDFCLKNVDSFDKIDSYAMPFCLKLMDDYADICVDILKRGGIDYIDSKNLIAKSLGETGFLDEFEDIMDALEEIKLLKNMKSSILEQKKIELFEDLDVSSECANGIYNVDCKIMDLVMKILIVEKVIPDVNFSSEKATELYKQIVRAFENSRITESEAIDHLCRCIEANPYHLWYPAYIFKINPRSESDILTLGEYLGIKEQLQIWIRTIKRNPDEIPGF